MCPTLDDPRDCSPPGSSVHEILLARILKWVSISFSRGSSQLRDWTQVSWISGRFFIIWVNRRIGKPGVLQSMESQSWIWLSDFHFTYLIPDKSVCRSRSDRTRHGKTDWLQIGKGVHQGCILSPCVFNLYTEYIMRNAGWSTSWKIKIVGRNNQ